MQILKTGSDVMVGEIKMKVVSASITGDVVSYSMVWYDGNSRNTAFVNDFEITSYEPEDLRTIGFRVQ
jgi:hypothetical protein